MLRTSCRLLISALNNFGQKQFLVVESYQTVPWLTNPLLHKRFVASVVKQNPQPTKNKQVELKKRVGKKKKTVEEVVGRTGYWNIAAFSTGDEYNIEELAKNLAAKDLFETTGLAKELQNPDFVHAVVKQDTNSQEPQEVFIFREGALVTWNVSEMDIEVLLCLIRKSQTGGYSDDIVREECELMNYTYGKPGGGTTLLDDDFILEPQDDPRLDKYAVSNAMATSVKLGTWEAALSRYIDSMEKVTDDLKKGNRIRMSQKEVMRKTGELFALRHAINLSSDLLDTPDVYWDREELEKVYQLTLAYFCINKRTRVINEKLNHCVELVELLSSHLRDNHHVRLEWMIIILIMVEVAFEVLHHLENHGKTPEVEVIFD